MLPTEDLFVYVYVLIHDLMLARCINVPARPGPEPAAHAEWFYGFRLAVKTDLGSRIVRAWAIVPAAVNEREVAAALLGAGPAPRDLLADKGFNGRAFAAAQAARGTAVLVPPDKKQRASMPPALLKIIAAWRNRIETTFSEITDRMELARHGAHSLWGLLTRTAATIAAHTAVLPRPKLAGSSPVNSPAPVFLAGWGHLRPALLSGQRR
jgi:hypothetical protein